MSEDEKNRFKSLQRFVPIVVWERYCVNPQELKEPIVEVYNAAVAIFDASGYSKLASDVEKQADDKMKSFRQRRGSSAAVLDVSSMDQKASISRLNNATSEGLLSHGPEMLTKHLNDFLTLLIEITDSSTNVEIVKFVGDACICQTRGNGDLSRPFTHLIHWLSHCALRLGNAVRDNEGGVLNFHAGIGASRVMGLHIGGLGRWEYFIAGDALRQMGEALDSAETGHVALSKEAYARAGDGYDGRELSSGTFLLSEVPSDSPTVDVQRFQNDIIVPSIVSLNAVNEALSGYIPSFVSSALIDGRSVNHGELRNLTVLFVKLLDLPNASSLLSDTNFKPVNYLRNVNEVMVLIQNQLIRNEAELRQFVMDDKGTVAIIAVGLPPMSHPDNGRRALRIACALKNSSRKMAIGVTTGTSYCGIVGDERRAEYAMVGDAIVLSARLMGKANSQQVLCDQDTKQSAERYFEFCALPPMLVKGRKDLVRVFELVGVHAGEEAGPATQINLVGCVRELQAVLEVVRSYNVRCKEKLKGGGSAPLAPGTSLIRLTGSAGSGKTSMLLRLKQEAEEGHVLMCTGRSQNEAVPYSNWGSFFGGALSNRGEVSWADSDVLSRASMQEVLTGLQVDRHLFPIINDVFPRLFHETKETVQMNRAQRHAVFADIVVQLVKGLLVHSGVTILLDEAHSFNGHDWLVVNRLCSELEGGALICVAATVAHGEALIRLDGEEKCVPLEVTLSDLHLRDLYMLLNAHYELPVVDGQLVDTLWAQCHGNPAQTLLLCEKLVDDGAVLCLAEEGRLCVVKDLSTVETSMDDKLAKKVLIQFDRLAPSQRLCLQVCSVVGRVLSVREAVALFKYQASTALPSLEITLDSVLKILHELCHKHLLSQDTSSHHHHSDVDTAHQTTHRKETTTFMFALPYIRSVIYSTTPQRDRTALHLQLALWYQETFVSDLSPHHAIVGHHYLMAEAHSQALSHLLEAAEIAMLESSPVEVKFVLEMCEEALEGVDTKMSPRQLAFFKARVKMMQGQGAIKSEDWAKAAQLFQQAISEFELITGKLRRRFSLLNARRQSISFAVDSTRSIVPEDRSSAPPHPRASVWRRIISPCLPSKTTSPPLPADLEAKPTEPAEADTPVSPASTLSGGPVSTRRVTIEELDESDQIYFDLAKQYHEFCASQLMGVIGLADTISRRATQMEQVTVQSIEEVPSLWEALKAVASQPAKVAPVAQRRKSLDRRGSRRESLDVGGERKVSTGRRGSKEAIRSERRGSREMSSIGGGSLVKVEEGDGIAPALVVRRRASFSQDILLLNANMNTAEVNPNLLPEVSGPVAVSGRRRRRSAGIVELQAAIVSSDVVSPLLGGVSDGVQDAKADGGGDEDGVRMNPELKLLADNLPMSFGLGANRGVIPTPGDEATGSRTPKHSLRLRRAGTRRTLEHDTDSNGFLGQTPKVITSRVVSHPKDVSIGDEDDSSNLSDLILQEARDNPVLTTRRRRSLFLESKRRPGGTNTDASSTGEKVIDDDGSSLRFPLDGGGGALRGTKADINSDRRAASSFGRGDAKGVSPSRRLSEFLKKLPSQDSCSSGRLPAGHKSEGTRKSSKSMGGESSVYVRTSPLMQPSSLLQRRASASTKYKMKGPPTNMSVNVVGREGIVGAVKK